VAILCLARGPAVVGALGLLIAASAPACAGEPVCDWAKASALHALSDRYRANGQLVASAREYAGAAHSIRDCQNAGGLLLTARLLAQGGAAGGDVSSLLSRLPFFWPGRAFARSPFAFDSRTTALGRHYFDAVNDAVAAFDRASLAL
jgi:hypothetical protein